MDSDVTLLCAVFYTPIISFPKWSKIHDSYSEGDAVGNNSKKLKREFFLLSESGKQKLGTGVGKDMRSSQRFLKPPWTQLGRTEPWLAWTKQPEVCCPAPQKPNYRKKGFPSACKSLTFSAVCNFTTQPNVLFNTKSTWSREPKGSPFVPSQQSPSSRMS